MDDTTNMFEAKLKNMKEKCAVVPYRIRIISRKVRAFGAFRLHCFEASALSTRRLNQWRGHTHDGQITENHNLCTVAGSIEKRPRNTVRVRNGD
jgi:hypothetical protein